MPFANRWQQLLRWLDLNKRLRLVRPALLVIAVVLLLLGIIFPSRWLLFLVYFDLLLILSAYLWVRLLGPRLQLLRHSDSLWVQVGDELEEHWSLTNQSPLPLVWLELHDSSNLPHYTASRVIASEPYKQQTWQSSILCMQRGVYKLGPLRARLSDPLDMFCFEWLEHTTRQLIVYPPLLRLPTLPLPEGQRGGLAQADLLQLYATPSVGGVRDYKPGDPPSRIHWPHVARHQRLVVKEFDQERAGALWLVLDLYGAAYPSDQIAHLSATIDDRLFQTSMLDQPTLNYQPASLLELGVSVTASLAAQLLAQGQAVGLLCDDGRRRMVTASPSAQQLWSILNELVDCQAIGQQPLSQLLRQASSSHWQKLNDAAVVVITPDLSASWLAELALNTRRPGGLLALLLAQQPTEALTCSRLLGAQGIHAHSFTLDTALPLLHPPRRRVTRRVSALGRVVRV